MKLSAFFTSSGTPQTGLSPTINVWLPAGDLIVTSASMIEVGGGWYYYELGGFENERDYFIRADGGASLTGSERYVFSVNAPVGGGGLSITGDMVMTLKKMEDNLATKKEIEELIKKLTGVVGDVSDKVDLKNEEGEENKNDLSKMSADVTDKIDLLIKDSKGTSKEMAKSLKDDLKFLTKGIKIVNMEVLKNKENIKKVIDLNNKVAKNVEKIENTTFPEVHKKIEGNHIILNKSSTALNSLAGNVSGMGKNFATEFVKVSGEISKLSSSNQEHLSKFKQEEGDNNKKVLEAFEVVMSKFQQVCQLMEQNKADTVKEIGGLVSYSDNAMGLKTEDIKEEIVNMKEDISKGNFNAYKKLKEETLSDQETIISLVSNLQDKVNSFKSDISSLLELRKEANSIEEEIKKLGTREDSENLSIILGDLSKKVSDMNVMIESKFAKISKKSKRKDDVGDVLDQMEMLGIGS